MSNKKIENAYLSDVDLIAKLTTIFQDHKEIINMYLSTQKDKTPNISTVKYATGGEIMHRGFLCPSPIKDMVVSNVRRGKMSKKRTDKCTYKYSFDELNRLVEVETLDEFTCKEYIWYEGNIQYGVQVMTTGNWNNEVSTISKCLYDDDKIIRYEFSVVSSANTKPKEYVINQIHIQEYFYNNNELTTILEYTYLVYKGDHYIANNYLYDLIRDTDNKVTSYNCIRMRDGKVMFDEIIPVQKYKQRPI